MSAYRKSDGPNSKQTQGRGNGRTGGNPRPQINKNSRNARQVMEEFLAFAMKASAAGDGIAAEGYFQYADHYYRLMRANSRDLEEREHRAQRQPTRHEDKPYRELGGNDLARLE